MRIVILVALMLSINLLAAQSEKESDGVNWLSFEKAIELNQKESRKIIVDVYTDWCGWCKKMESTTYSDPAIVRYINEKYYAVKLDAERKDTVRLGEQIFINQNPEGRRSPHDLAVSLLNGKMGYPSTVFLDEKVELLNPPISGYLDAKTLEPMLHYFGDNVYSKKETNWVDYQKNYKRESE